MITTQAAPSYPASSFPWPAVGKQRQASMRSKGRRLEVRDCASWILKGSQNCHMSWWNFVSCKYAAWNLAQSDRKKCLLDHPLLRKCLTANLILLTRDTMRLTEKGGKVPLFYEIATLMFTIFTWTNNAPCLSPQIWHNLCFQFLLDIAVVPMVLQNFGG